MCQPCNVYLSSIPSNSLAPKAASTALLGRVFFNHQKLLVSFTQNSSGKLVGRVDRGEISSEGLKVFFDRNQKVFQLNSPKEITFYPQQSAIVIGTYGLKGGMRGSSGSGPASASGGAEEASSSSSGISEGVAEEVSSSSSSMSRATTKETINREIATRGGRQLCVLHSAIERRNELLCVDELVRVDFSDIFALAEIRDERTRRHANSTIELVKNAFPKLFELTKHDDTEIQREARKTIRNVVNAHKEIKKWMIEAVGLYESVSSVIQDVSIFDETIRSFSKEIDHCIRERNTLEAAQLVSYLHVRKMARLRTSISTMMEDVNTKKKNLLQLRKLIADTEIEFNNKARDHKEKQNKVSGTIFKDQIKRYGADVGMGIAAASSLGATAAGIGLATGSVALPAALPAALVIGTVSLPITATAVAVGAGLFALGAAGGAYSLGCTAGDAKQRVENSRKIQEGLEELINHMTRIESDLSKIREFGRIFKALSLISNTFEVAEESLAPIANLNEQMPLAIFQTEWNAFYSQWTQCHASTEEFRNGMHSIEFEKGKEPETPQEG